MDLWIAQVAGATTTHGAMVLAVTFSVDSAFVFQDAGIHALTVVTSSCVVTLAVRLAVQFEATELRVPGVAGRAYARWIMIRNVTLRVRTTIARVDAQAVDTCSVTCTIAVRTTLGHDTRRDTVDSRITFVIGGTPADWNVIVHVAKRVPSARISDDAWIHTE